jgi:hypothetical protein
LKSETRKSTVRDYLAIGEKVHEGITEELGKENYVAMDSDDFLTLTGRRRKSLLRGSGGNSAC